MTKKPTVEFEYHSNGNKKGEYSYIGENLNGVSRWDEDGNLEYEKNYKDDDFDGVQTMWNENGNKHIELRIDKGVISSLVIWNDDGTIREVESLVDGKNKEIFKHKGKKRSLQRNRWSIFKKKL